MCELCYWESQNRFLMSGDLEVLSAKSLLIFGLSRHFPPSPFHYTYSPFEKRRGCFMVNSNPLLCFKVVPFYTVLTLQNNWMPGTHSSSLIVRGGLMVAQCSTKSECLVAFPFRISVTKRIYLIGRMSSSIWYFKIKHNVSLMFFWTLVFNIFCILGQWKSNYLNTCYKTSESPENNVLTVFCITVPEAN